jgi:hypothetical protein
MKPSIKTTLNPIQFDCVSVTTPATGSVDSWLWWSRSGSNRRPQACKARALPTELRPPERRASQVVGPGRVERPTSRLSGVRSNHLSYEPETPRLAFQDHFASQSQTRVRHTRPCVRGNGPGIRRKEGKRRRRQVAGSRKSEIRSRNDFCTQVRFMCLSSEVEEETIGRFRLPISGFLTSESLERR